MAEGRDTLRMYYLCGTNGIMAGKQCQKMNPVAETFIQHSQGFKACQATHTSRRAKTTYRGFPLKPEKRRVSPAVVMNSVSGRLLPLSRAVYFVRSRPAIVRPGLRSAAESICRRNSKSCEVGNKGAGYIVLMAISVVSPKKRDLQSEDGATGYPANFDNCPTC